MFTGGLATSITNLIPSTTSEQRCALIHLAPSKEKRCFSLGGWVWGVRKGLSFVGQLAGLN